MRWELILGLALDPMDGRGAGECQLFVPAKPMILSVRPRKLEAFMGIDQDSPINTYFIARTRTVSLGINIDGSMYGTSFRE